MRKGKPIMTVGRLINLLQTLNEDESIVFQFIIAEHTLYTPEEFEEIADYLDESDSFGDETARILKDWCRVATLRMEGKEY
jgi:hypothetical protein